MKKAIFWHRRDLRIRDNAALFHALKNKVQVLPIFIFDVDILSKLDNKNDARVNFIYREVKRLKEEYERHGSTLLVMYGKPQEVFQKLVDRHEIISVFTNKDYEPCGIERDQSIQEFLSSKRIEFHSFKDQVIFEESEICKDDGKPYTVFTPYSKKWKSKLTQFYLSAYPTFKYISNLSKERPYEIKSLEEMGFNELELTFPDRKVNRAILKKYKEQRDIPSIRGTSRLSLHLRFGTLSIRELALEGHSMNETWLNELIWRDFYMMILFHFPHVVHSSFRPKYDRIVWRNNLEEFEAWCKGQTGYPIVDAGMRELNATGFMHNRVRMIVASFLTKHLLIDWRWGEAYFAEKLLDFELASNNGGWQWASGSGCDAAPYFRVFNPSLQTKRFDPELKYIKRWVPEFEDPFSYIKPIVDHKFARNRAIDTYKKFLNYTE
ncbi:MAG: deoxyribodipyrimidine photo-lyase [Bacteroidota bacterium]